jgi:endonuclease/exonuclease/phosphatase family metal-dependent hydrolase
MYTFSVASINLRGRAARWSSRRHLVVGQLVDAQPVVVALQETGGHGGWVARQVNIRLTGDARRPYRALQAGVGSWPRRAERVAILSTLPIIYSEAVQLPHDGVALRANLELPAGAAGTRRQSLDFVSVRLWEGGGSAEGSGDVESRHVGLPSRRAARAAGAAPDVDGEARLVQAMALTGRLTSHRRVPLQVAAGDFGESPDGPASVFMRQSYRSAYAEAHGRDPLATYPTQPMRGIGVCLDYVFLSPAVNKTVSAAIFGDKAAADDESLYPSDHVGLLVELEV